MNKSLFDYIVVGAGSAGIIVAHRLANNGFKVALIEAGSSKSNIWSDIPGAYYKLINSNKFNWNFKTLPEKKLNNRVIPCPRGKILGGSSAINGLIYIRGAKNDYNNWAYKTKSEYWNYNNVLKRFKKHEKNKNFKNFFHESSGEVGISFPHYNNKVIEKFMDLASKKFSYNADFNGETLEGYGFYQLTMLNGVRSSTYKSFFKKINKNITIFSSSIVNKILFSNLKAIGVEYLFNDKLYNLFSNNEVIICAGAIGTPTILQRSGIGEKSLLDSLSIPCLVESPHVGKNLKDHFQARIIYETNKKYSLNTIYYSNLRKLQTLFKYLFFRKGELTIGAGVAGLFFHSCINKDIEPDLQLHIIPFSAKNPGELYKIPGVTCSVTQLRPKSSGYINITSVNPKCLPSINFNYLDHKEDIDSIIDGLKIIYNLFSIDTDDNFFIKIMQPSPNFFDSTQRLEEYIRATGTTIFHPVGTCKMSSFDSHDGVVNPDLTVKGVSCLRVADASIMPEIISGNTNAACMMIGESMADIILNENIIF